MPPLTLAPDDTPWLVVFTRSPACIALLRKLLPRDPSVDLCQEIDLWLSEATYAYFVFAMSPGALPLSIGLRAADIEELGSVVLPQIAHGMGAAKLSVSTCRALHAPLHAIVWKLWDDIKRLPLRSL